MPEKMKIQLRGTNLVEIVRAAEVAKRKRIPVSQQTIHPGSPTQREESSTTK